MEEWGVEKNKTTGHFFHRGSSDQDTYTHRPYLDLDFRKKRNLEQGCTKNVTWQGEAPKNVTWQGRGQKNVT